MKKIILPTMALISTQLFAGLTIDATYGKLFPSSSSANIILTYDASTSVTVDGGNTTHTDNDQDHTYTFKMERTNFFDIALSESNSGLGVIYSANVNPTKLVFNDTVSTYNENANDHDLEDGINSLSWKYKAMYVSYKHNLGQNLLLNLALGSATQYFTSSSIGTDNKELTVNQSDIAARVGLGYVYQLSKSARAVLGVSYNYFKDLSIDTGEDSGAQGTEPDYSLLRAQGTLKTSGIAGTLTVAIDV